MKKYFLLLVIFIIFYGTIFYILNLSLKRTDGKLIYFPDDAYIHFAIAKNFAKYNIWGLTKYEFSSSSSSPLWTFLLAILYKIFGIKDIIPFLLNLIISSFLIFYIYKLSYQFFNKFLIHLSFLMFIIFAIPIPLLVFSGMEHLLHCLLCILVIDLFTKLILNSSYARKNLFYFLVLILLCSTIRYEGLIIIFSIILIALVKRKYLLSFLTILFSSLPVVIIGIIQKYHDWYFLPNSVILKGNRLGLSVLNLNNYLTSVQLNLFSSYTLFLLFIILLILLLFQFTKGKVFSDRFSIFSSLFIISSIIHCALKSPDTKWFYRYEAYLMTIGILSFISFDIYNIEEKFENLISQLKNIQEKITISLVFVLIIFLVGFLFRLRIVSLILLPFASQNVYHQQYQMGLFLGKFYRNKAVAVNDIGAVSYLAEIKLLDLWGLGSKHVAEAKLKNKFNKDFVTNWTEKENCEIAIIYEDWFRIGVLPDNWIKVAEWKIKDNVVCARDTVSFWACNGKKAEMLISNIQEFSSHLPLSVEEKYY